MSDFHRFSQLKTQVEMKLIKMDGEERLEKSKCNNKIRINHEFRDSQFNLL